MTPHISAKKGKIAKLVLMPGDPLRAEYIAKTFLTNIELVNSVRGMLMYTGEYKNKRVSICGSGMGQPSIGIYSYELYKFYGVQKIVRVGSAGSYKKDLRVHELVLATSAYSDSSAFSELVLGQKHHLAFPSEQLNKSINDVASKRGIALSSGQVHSSDVFYSSRLVEETIAATQAICVEMESAALFINAKKLGKEAACLLTISDNLINGTSLSAEDRQTTFGEMVKLALESI